MRLVPEVISFELHKSEKGFSYNANKRFIVLMAMQAWQVACVHKQHSFSEE